MSAHHLHVIKPVLTLWVVLCALVMMAMYWIMMDCPAMVSKHHTCINTLTLFIIIDIELPIVTLQNPIVQYTNSTLMISIHWMVSRSLDR